MFSIDFYDFTPKWKWFNSTISNQSLLLNSSEKFKSPLDTFRKEINLLHVHESNFSQQVTNNFLCLQRSIRWFYNLTKSCYWPSFIWYFWSIISRESVTNSSKFIFPDLFDSYNRGLIGMLRLVLQFSLHYVLLTHTAAVICQGLFYGLWKTNKSGVASHWSFVFCSNLNEMCLLLLHTSSKIHSYLIDVRKCSFVAENWRAIIIKVFR